MGKRTSRQKAVCTHQGRWLLSTVWVFVGSQQRIASAISVVENDNFRSPRFLLDKIANLRVVPLLHDGFVFVSDRIYNVTLYAIILMESEPMSVKLEEVHLWPGIVNLNIIYLVCEIGSGETVLHFPPYVGPLFFRDPWFQELHLASDDGHV